MARLAVEPIDFQKIASETGVRKGKISYSATFQSWVVIGHPDINMICIEPPKQIGEKILDQEIKGIRIENNHWEYHSVKV